MIVVMRRGATPQEVEHVIERSGALTFQIKQAEALVETMRRERTLACEVSAAVAAVRAEDETDAQG